MFYVAVGATRVDAAARAGEGARARWIEGSALAAAVAAAGSDAGDPLDALLAALQAIQPGPGALAAGRVRVVVDDHWLAVAGVPWSPAAMRVAADQAYARAHLAAEGFEVGPFDTLRLDDGPYGVPRLAVAYPAALVSALQQLAERFGARLGSVLPLSVVAWKFARKVGAGRADAVAVVDAGSTLFVQGGQGGGDGAAAVIARLHAGPGANGLPSALEIWRRLCLRDPRLAGAGRVALVDLVNAPGSGTPLEPPFEVVRLPASENASSVALALRLAAAARAAGMPLDALRSVPKQGAVRWAAVALAAVVAGTAVLHAARTSHTAQRRAVQLQGTATVAPPAARPVAWSREELAHMQAVNTAIRQLNLPIAAMMRALQPPPDIRVAVLSVDTADRAAAAGASSVKIVAEARTGAEMARYVAFVSDRKPFTGAYLMRHEIDDGSPERSYRFTVEALWSD